jgi:hypothetical protein
MAVLVGAVHVSRRTHPILRFILTQTNAHNPSTNPCHHRGTRISSSTRRSDKYTMCAFPITNLDHLFRYILSLSEIHKSLATELYAQVFFLVTSINTNDSHARERTLAGVRECGDVAVV